MIQKIGQINSFDRQILQDQLLKVLKRSPQTMIYTQNRVSQIIIQLISVPLIKELQIKVQTLQAIIEQMEEQRQVQGSVYTKKQAKYVKTIKQWRVQKKEMQKELQRYKQIQRQKNEYILTIKSLQKIKIQSSKQLQQLSDKYVQIEQTLVSKNQQIQHLQQQIKNLQHINNIKIQQNKQLSVNYQKLKRTNKQTKYNQVKFKKQYEALQCNFQEIAAELIKVTEQLKIEKLHRDNQSKAMHNKLNQLYRKCKNKSKAWKKMHSLQIINERLKKQLNSLKQHFVSGIEMLQTQFKHVSNSIMDQIGDQINRELKQVITQMNKNSLQLRLFRQQIKIKDEIIKMLQKASSLQIMGNRELQKQLKQKKMEVDLLRKQMKINIQKNQIKNIQLECNCKHILTNHNFLLY